MRTGPGTEYAKISKYPSITKGTKIGVCDTKKSTSGESWYYVCISGSAGNCYGYVSAAYIQKYVEATQAAVDPTVKPNGKLEKTPIWNAEVTAASLNIRSGAGTSFARLKTYPSLAKGTKVELCDSIYATDGTLWYYIRINKRTYGFASSLYLKKLSKIN